MKETTMLALSNAEEYFVAVVKQEAHGAVVPSRTEELHHAIEGLEGISFIKYKQWLKSGMVSNSATTPMTPPIVAPTAMVSYKH